MVAPRRKTTQQETLTPSADHIPYKKIGGKSAAKRRQAGISWLFPDLGEGEMMEMRDVVHILEQCIVPISSDGKVSGEFAHLIEALNKGKAGTKHILPVMSMMLNSAAKQEGFEQVPQELINFVSAQAAGKSCAEEMLILINLMSESQKADNCHPMITKMLAYENGFIDEDGSMGREELSALLHAGNVSMSDDEAQKLLSLWRLMYAGKANEDDFMPVMRMALNGIAAVHGVPPPPEEFIFWCSANAAGKDHKDQMGLFMPLVNWVLTSFETGKFHPWLKTMVEAEYEEDDIRCPLALFF